MDPPALAPMWDGPLAHEMLCMGAGKEICIETSKGELESLELPSPRQETTSPSLSFLVCNMGPAAELTLTALW